MKKISVLGLLFLALILLNCNSNVSSDSRAKMFYKFGGESNISYELNLDSAKYYKIRDIEKSLSFVEKNIKANQNKKKEAITYTVLADIYFYWNQYDLAIENYKISIEYFDSVLTQIKLAKSQFLFEDYDSSEHKYIQLLSKELSSNESVLIYEGLADVYFETNNNAEAKLNYEKALYIAKKRRIISKITDLNSKIAEVFSAMGDISMARDYFRNSLNLASKEGKIRLLEEEEKVADFYNSKGLYTNEIQLRKNTLTKVNDSLKQKKSYFFTNLSGSLLLFTTVRDKKENVQGTIINSQRINYKIARAYALKEEYEKAIPYLKTSILEAKREKDLIVQKDATRKLSEVYENLGKHIETIKAYEGYVKLVDKAHVQKSQEIAEAKRFNKKIIENQNRISSLEKDKELTRSKINLKYIDQKLSEESNKRQRQIIYSLAGGILLLILLAYLQIRNSRQQKLANNLLALKSMRSQMNPHFIFNALNSVNSYIALNDERNANRYLSEFAILMRTVLENSDEDFIPLTKEIELIELYVKLEHNRFKDKFGYHVFIDSNINLEDFNIPPMLLQPYIENAIWHGLRYKEEMGELLISMEVYDHETIRIVIQDDGIGRGKSKELKTENQLKRKSKGMITIKNRIAILNDMYKEKISVNVTDAFENGEGTKVELLLKRI